MPRIPADSLLRALELMEGTPGAFSLIVSYSQRAAGINQDLCASY